MLEGMLASWSLLALGTVAAPVEAAEPDAARSEAIPVQTPAGVRAADEPAAETSPVEPANADAKAELAEPAAPADPDATALPSEPAAPTGPATVSAVTTPQTSDPAPPSGAEATAGAKPEPTEPTEPARPPRTYPRLVIAGGPMIGPHAFGNEECKSEIAECQTKGSFFGVGGQVELRGRVWRPLYLHVRGLAVRNVSPNDPVYAGVVGAGAGVGAYARRIFGRVEYQYVHAMGDNRFEPPFFDGAVATDEWDRHAGQITVGFCQPLPRNLAIELWGGLMLGPRSTRTVAQEEPDERRLTTFQVGLNLAWDAWR